MARNSQGYRHKAESWEEVTYNRKAGETKGSRLNKFHVDVYGKGYSVASNIQGYGKSGVQHIKRNARVMSHRRWRKFVVYNETRKRYVGRNRP